MHQKRALEAQPLRKPHRGGCYKNNLEDLGQTFLALCCPTMSIYKYCECIEN